jgi:hypothetical protein
VSGSIAIDPGFVQTPTSSAVSVAPEPSTTSLLGQTITLPASGVCSGIRNCGYYAEGALVVQNTTGLLDFIAAVVTRSDVGTFVPGPNVVISRTVVPAGEDLYRHEMAHVRQARALSSRTGSLWWATYGAEWAYQALHHGLDGAYKYNAFEIGANLEAKLDPFWHVGNVGR